MRNRNIDKVFTLNIDEDDVPVVFALVFRSGLLGSEKEMKAVQNFIESNLKELSDKTLFCLQEEIDITPKDSRYNHENTGKLTAVAVSIIEEKRRRRQL